MPDVSAPRPAFVGAAGLTAAIVLYALLARDPAGLAALPAPLPPPPLPAPPPSPTLETVAPAPPVSTDGLVLYGVSGGGSAGMAAIIGMASGYPRIVPVGREYRPGLVVKEVGATHAVLADAGRETRLELNGSRSTVSSQPSPAPAPPPAPGLAGMDAPALRLGLRPQKANGRITGFELKAGADLPVLHRAGLRPGDVILAVNGQAFESEEKLLELPREIAGSYVAEFEVERAGDRIKLSLPVNPTSPASK